MAAGLQRECKMETLGVMQGRLTPQTDNRIQFFPLIGWREEFPTLKKLGISHLEWTFDRNGLFENPILTTSGCEEVNYLAKSFKVSIGTATCDNLMNAPIHKVGPDGQTSSDEFEKFIELVAKSTISTLVWPLVDAGSIKDSKELELFLVAISKHFNLLAKHGIKVAFETDLSPLKNLDLMEKLPQNLFGLNLDIGNSASYGHSIVEEWNLNSNRILNIHIKDRLFEGLTVPLGSGSVSWSEVKYISDRYNKLMILQCARIAAQQERETITRYINFLKTVEVI